MQLEDSFKGKLMFYAGFERKAISILVTRR